MTSRSSSSRDRRMMTNCGSGIMCQVQLLWLAVAAVTATVTATTVSTRSLPSQPPSACQQQQQQLSPLRPTDLWQFADASVSAVANSCRFTIDAPSKSASVASTSRGAATTLAAATVVGTQSYSLPSNASATPQAPQLLVVRLISWHPGSLCLSETCSRNSSVQLQGDGGSCAVALSIAPRSPRSLGVGDSSRSTEALLLMGGRDGKGSSSSSSASAAATIAWSDAALSAIVNGSGCCGTRLLLGYKVAPARSACHSSTTLSTASTPPLSSSSSSSDSPSRRQYSTPELIDKYTYMFAQDRKLGWLPQGAAEAATSAAACLEGEDYELIILPAAAGAAALAEQEVRFDLLTAPRQRSCRRLCIADDCSPRLGVFNASGRRSLSLRYEYRPAASAAESGGACVNHEYSGFTLRLLAPSRVQFAAYVSPPLLNSPGASDRSDWVLIIALAAGAVVILIALTAVIAVLVVRHRRRSHLSAAPNMEMRSLEMSCRGQLPQMATDAACDNDQNRYGDVRYNVGGKSASSRERSVENAYWKLGMSTDGEAAGMESEQDHVYEQCLK